MKKQSLDVQCDLCGSDDTRAVRGAVHQCLDCGSYFDDAQPAAPAPRRTRRGAYDDE